MSGPNTLRYQKSLLTRYKNTLHRVISENGPALARENALKTLVEGITAIRESANLLSNTLNGFVQSLDQLAGPTTEDQQKANQAYIDETLDALEEAEELLIRMEAKKAGLQAVTPEVGVSGGGHLNWKPELPTIPIPTFDGKMSEFENFWALFRANIHDQNLSGLQKFNYLLRALKGSAKEAIRRYPITEENYTAALELLHSKYGDKAKLVRNLQGRMESATAKNNQISEQRNLLEYLISLTAQLRQQGVTLKGSFIAQKILAKFNVDLQRRLLKQRVSQDHDEDSWMVEDLLSDLDVLIKTEERVAEMIHENDPYRRRPSGATEAKSNKFESRAQCVYCDAHDHNALRCPKISTAEDRKEFMKQKKLCMNCARRNHFLRECTGTGCAKCGGEKHHFSLCPKRLQELKGTPAGVNTQRNSSTAPQSKQGRGKPGKHPTRVNAQLTESAEPEEILQAATLHSGETLNGGELSQVYLLTGQARVENAKTGKSQMVQILLDTGADRSFIQKRLAEALELPVVDAIELSVHTFGAKAPRKDKYDVTTLKIWDRQNNPVDLVLCKADVISGKGKQLALSAEDVKHLKRKGIQLPWSGRNVIKPEVLLGCDQLWALLDFQGKQYTLPSGLHAIPSRLGYLITGKAWKNSQNSRNETVCEHLESEPDIIFRQSEETSESEKWDQYWSLDSAGVQEYPGPINTEKASVAKKVQEFFNNTIEKRSDGYYVRLPFKENCGTLPNNYNLAFKRLCSVLQSLRENPDLLAQYEEVFRSQLDKGIIEEIESDPSNCDSKVTHYLPHQAVVTPQKETTKLRVVFDAASHYRNCPSLNEVLHPGDKLLPDLYGMLLRFRLAPYVAIADVEKAFLQVRLNECDRDATRFLWVRDTALPAEGDNLVAYRFTRVTFGLNVSPFLLAGTIRFHLQHYVSDTSLAKEIKDNLYVDNLILTSDSPRAIVDKSLAANAIFEDMKMNLREFLSNSRELQQALPALKYAKNSKQKVLGVLWHSEGDTLFQSCKLPTISKVTKRTVTKQLASIYDPLGWLVPLLIKAKLFQQGLWMQGYEWDQELSTQQKAEWEAIVSAIEGYKRQFSRYLPITECSQMALFSDASEKAMATCAYLISGSLSNLLMAKSKLPSIKAKTTIPKLELNALTMSARLALSVLKAMGKNSKNIARIVLFSDSQIVLSWIKKSPNSHDLGVFISNRVKEIHAIVSAIEDIGPKVLFGYIPTSINPADAGTRGLSKGELLDSKWWNGPEFLNAPFSSWEQSFFALSSGIPLSVNAMSSEVEDWIPLSRYGSLVRAERVMAWVLKFLRRLIQKLSRDRAQSLTKSFPELKLTHGLGIEIINGTDMQQAKKALVRIHQSSFSRSYLRTMDNTLKLFKDGDNIWRARGRLGCSDLSEESKFPILIASKSDLARLIIQNAHGKYHSGIAHTMSNVRQSFWIPRLRQQARTFINRCVRCRRFNGAPYQYPAMTDLPAQRVQKSRPFEHIGLDFFDLPEVQDEGTLSKVYGCIFTCAVTRMIHIEVVRNMGTEAFINALRRFFSRRGVPATVTCDNAPTFLLTSEILADIVANAATSGFIANHAIKWNHITPKAPWQGGFYERLIQSIKHAFYKAIGRAKLTMDDLVTAITEIEASLNTRPLTYQESDLEQFSVIRPIDFVQKGLKVSFPFDQLQLEHSDSEYIPPDRVAALQTRKQAESALKTSYSATQQIWKAWHAQYLLSLREQHRKWMSSNRRSKAAPHVGAIVLLVDPIQSRNEWKLARITAIHRGDDNAIREVCLLTATGRTIKRPVNLIIPLELDCDFVDQESDPPLQPDYQAPLVQNRYNLRKRLPVSYQDCVETAEH